MFHIVGKDTLIISYLCDSFSAFRYAKNSATDFRAAGGDAACRRMRHAVASDSRHQPGAERGAGRRRPHGQPGQWRQPGRRDCRGRDRRPAGHFDARGRERHADAAAEAADCDCQKQDRMPLQICLKRARHLRLLRLHDVCVRQGGHTPQRRVRPCDPVFFSGSRISSTVGHVGMVLDYDKKTGSFTFIHASCSEGIEIQRSSADYYARRYIGARRILE